eukprot:1593582-Prymnesium_polylepis.1
MVAAMPPHGTREHHLDDATRLVHLAARIGDKPFDVIEERDGDIRMLDGGERKVIIQKLRRRQA